MLKKRGRSKIKTKQISKNRFLFVSKKWLNFSMMKIIKRPFQNLKFINQFSNMSLFHKSVSSKAPFSSKKRLFVQFFQKIFFRNIFVPNQKQIKKKLRTEKKNVNHVFEKKSWIQIRNSFDNSIKTKNFKIRK